MLVDDDDKLIAAYRRGFALEQKRVFTAKTPQEARSIAKAERPDLAVVDLLLGRELACDLLCELRASQPALVLVVASGLTGFASAAMTAGANAVLLKPVTPSQILRRLESDLEQEKPPRESLAQAQWRHIVSTLAEVQGNISEAARRLRIPRQSLQRMLKKDAPRDWLRYGLRRKHISREAADDLDGDERSAPAERPATSP